MVVTRPLSPSPASATLKETPSAVVQTVAPPDASDRPSVVVKTLRASGLAHVEVEILGMLAAAKEREPERFAHVVAPRDVYLNEHGEHVVAFDALRQWDSSPMPLQRAGELAMQLFLALEAIHELGIAHLDVNPTNIMLDHNDRLVLIDFGLARVCDGTPHPPGRGTRGYVAPELFPPRSCTTTHPDLYAAGVVFGQLIEPYLSHCNLRILGGSACFPMHVEEIWDKVREFVEIDALCHDDLFPPILQLAADLLLRLITASTPTYPADNHRYMRLSASAALKHPFLRVLQDPQLATSSFRYMQPHEWGLRNAGQQLAERKRRRGIEFARVIG